MSGKAVSAGAVRCSVPNRPFFFLLFFFCWVCPAFKFKLSFCSLVNIGRALAAANLRACGDLHTKLFQRSFTTGLSWSNWTGWQFCQFLLKNCATSSYKSDKKPGHFLLHVDQWEFNTWTGDPAPVRGKRRALSSTCEPSLPVLQRPFPVNSLAVKVAQN